MTWRRRASARTLSAAPVKWAELDAKRAIRQATELAMEV
jgi:hypothetical protein